MNATIETASNDSGAEGGMTNVLVLGGGFAGVWARSAWPVAWAMASRTQGSISSINIQWVYPPADSTDVLLANAGHTSNGA